MPRLTEVASGVLVATAEYDTTTTTVVTAPGRDCLVIDPAVTVADLSALAAELAGAGLRPRAGFATHPHWDHVLWSRELGAVPRYAAPAALVVTTGQRAEMIAAVEQSAPGHDLALFADLVALPGDAAHIPWPGPAAQVIAHEGHAPGHAAVFLPGPGVLVAGDMLSDIEIPLLDTAAADPLGDYRAGLRRLAEIPGVRWLVPGHGHVTGAAGFRRRVDSDTRYLDRLAAGQPFTDPRAVTGWQREWHDRQLRKVTGSS